MGIVFGVQDEIAFPGWRYVTVAAGSRLQEDWPLRADQPHALVVRGPNGFQREFRGSGVERIAAQILWREDGSGGTLHLASRGAAAVGITMHCAHGSTRDQFTLSGTMQRAIRLADHRWYDLLLTSADGTSLRLAGHVETGRPGISEPAPAFPHPV